MTHIFSSCKNTVGPESAWHVVFVVCFPQCAHGLLFPRLFCALQTCWKTGHSHYNVDVCQGKRRMKVEHKDICDIWVPEDPSEPRLDAQVPSGQSRCAVQSLLRMCVLPALLVITGTRLLCDVLFALLCSPILLSFAAVVQSDAPTPVPRPPSTSPTRSSHEVILSLLLHHCSRTPFALSVQLHCSLSHVCVLHLCVLHRVCPCRQPSPWQLYAAPLVLPSPQPLPPPCVCPSLPLSRTRQSARLSWLSTRH